ncbi:hypothetical protein CEXT_256341 [Caerostris extrusa]|uniref:Uncharacterized protein n=1 Tax=Caerostris extrusa TaxID=172846 RepID=A0AAV4M6I2_CAEEX|nr:hypothetical protein CEXT_256341 [Caerostris extrusa]
MGCGDEDIVVPLRTNDRGLNGRSLLAWNSLAISADAWMLRRLRDKSFGGKLLFHNSPSSETVHPKEIPSTNRLASTTSIVLKGHLLSLGGIPKTQASPPSSKREERGWMGVGDEDIVVPLRTNGRGLNGWSLLAWNSEAISADAWMLRRLKDKSFGGSNWE